MRMSKNARQPANLSELRFSVYNTGLGAAPNSHKITVKINGVNAHKHQQALSDDSPALGYVCLRVCV